jgi:hypothetical protein
VSYSDEIFLALAEPLIAAAAQRVADVLGLEYLGVMPQTGDLQYKVRARTFDGWIGVFVGPNNYGPEPDEVQAMDGYPITVDVQSRNRKANRRTKHAWPSRNWLMRCLRCRHCCPTIWSCWSPPTCPVRGRIASNQVSRSTTRTSKPGAHG